MNTWWKRCLVVAAAVGAVTAGTVAISHPGNLDANGCHHDHINGGYHCHR